MCRDITLRLRVRQIGRRLPGAIVLLGLLACALAGCGPSLLPPLTLKTVLAAPEASLMYPHARLNGLQIEDPNSNNSMGFCCSDVGTVTRLSIAPAPEAAIRSWYARWLRMHGWRACPPNGTDADGYIRGNDLYEVDMGDEVQQDAFHRFGTAFVPPHGARGVRTILDVYTAPPTFTCS